MQYNAKRKRKTKKFLNSFLQFYTLHTTLIVIKIGYSIYKK